MTSLPRLLPHRDVPFRQPCPQVPIPSRTADDFEARVEREVRNRLATARLARRAMARQAELTQQQTGPEAWCHWPVMG